MSATQYQNALICLAISGFVVGVAQSASAMETEVALNDDMAIKGGVTPGDAPGYPITIPHSGRYRLTSNLYPPGEISAIEIKNGCHHRIRWIYAVRPRRGGFWYLRSWGLNNVMIMNGFIEGFKNPAIIDMTHGSSKICVSRTTITASNLKIMLGF